MPQTMPRRTIYLPESIQDLVEEHAHEDESFSATVVRLIELGALDDDREDWPDWIGSIERGLPSDLGINAEKYLGIKPWGPGEGPKEPDDQSSR